MVFTASELLEWSDFPKGLRVLLFDEDIESSAEIKLKLDKMDYVVSSFCNEDDAFVAISNRSHNFHVAIVEVNTENSCSRFRFLESAKDLPTIMISNMQCLNTMMKCISLGAVEFLLKPLSDDKLKNLWQHVVHKAFNARDKDMPESLNPTDSYVLSMLDPQPTHEEQKSILSVKTEVNNELNSAMSDKCPTPPTPQLIQGMRLLDTVDFVDQTNSSMNRDNLDQVEESKSVETTSCNIADEVNTKTSSGENIVNREDQGDDSRKSKSNLSPQPKTKDVHKKSVAHNSSEKKAHRKKMKVDWTPELHKKFVKAVEQLGVDQAIPSRILELMKVQGLTRHNIASHLQKYRMQHRPILPKEDNRRWPILSRKGYDPHRPVMVYPPYHNTNSATGPVYPSWVPHGNYPSGMQMWAPAYYPPWQHNETWHWQQYPGMQADAWGCPVMPPPHEHYPPPPQNFDGYRNVKVDHGSYSVTQDSFDHAPADEEIDRVVKEAISKPWLPLPIGLNPPSTDSVLNELSNQRIYPTIHNF